MCIYTGNFDSFFFSELRPFLNFEIWPKWKILLKQLVSATPLKPLNRIAWNFVVMKDIMCRYAFLQKCWFDPFEEQFISPFFSDCPSLMLGIAIHTAFSSNVGAWCMWACSLFLSSLKIYFASKIFFSTPEHRSDDLNIYVVMMTKRSSTKQCKKYTVYRLLMYLGFMLKLSLAIIDLYLFDDEAFDMQIRVL